MPAISSMADNLVTIAPITDSVQALDTGYIRYISDDLPCFDSSFEPRASVVVVTISIASGIEATMSTTVNESASTT